MKVANYFFACMVMAVVCGGMYLLLPALTAYRQSSSTLAELTNTVAVQNVEIEALRREIEALKNDSRAIERVAREKFGYCRPGEKVYHFDTPAK